MYSLGDGGPKHLGQVERRKCCVEEREAETGTLGWKTGSVEWRRGKQRLAPWDGRQEVLSGGEGSRDWHLGIEDRKEAVQGAATSSHSKCANLCKVDLILKVKVHSDLQ